jgi:hypothetical protein
MECVLTNGKEKMMRKLLVLTLVLGMATAANAVIVQVNGQTGEVLVNPGEVAAITVISEDAANWLGYLIVPDGHAGALSNAAVTDLAGDLSLAGAAEYAEGGWGAGFELATGGTASTPAGVGVQFTMDYSYADYVEGTTLQLFIDPDYDTPAAAVSIIPEPMTVVLLGLGGLFLRRRK